MQAFWSLRDSTQPLDVTPTTSLFCEPVVEHQMFFRKHSLPALLTVTLPVSCTHRQKVLLYSDTKLSIQYITLFLLLKYFSQYYIVNVSYVLKVSKSLDFQNTSNDVLCSLLMINFYRWTTGFSTWSSTLTLHTIFHCTAVKNSDIWDQTMRLCPLGRDVLTSLSLNASGHTRDLSLSLYHPEKWAAFLWNA